MKKIGIIPNTTKDSNLSFTKEIIKWLLEKNCTPMLTNKTAESINYSEHGVPINTLYTDSEFLIVLGGDGTVLRVAKYAAVNNKPILGVNRGTLGYLTDVEENDCFVALEKILNGEFILEKRMMLEAVNSIDTENDTLIALNDVCISRGFFGNLISIEVRVNGEYIDQYRADGIIVSTPTGSTAYNLSAGGPILKPDANMIAITPICPHMLYSRPFVISSDDIVTLKIINKRSVEILMSLDGQNLVLLKDGDIVTIKASSYYSTIIKTNKFGFYDILRNKMVGVSELKNEKI